jgi:hypothetical protein
MPRPAVRANVWHSVQYLGSCRGIPLQQAHDIVILSTVLQPHFLDHAQLSKLGDMPGPEDRPHTRT